MLLPPEKKSPEQGGRESDSSFCRYPAFYFVKPVRNNFDFRRRLPLIAGLQHQKPPAVGRNIEVGSRGQWAFIRTFKQHPGPGSSKRRRRFDVRNHHLVPLTIEQFRSVA